MKWEDLCPVGLIVQYVKTFLWSFKFCSLPSACSACLWSVATSFSARSRPKPIAWWTATTICVRAFFTKRICQHFSQLSRSGVIGSLETTTSGKKFVRFFLQTLKFALLGPELSCEIERITTFKYIICIIQVPSGLHRAIPAACSVGHAPRKVKADHQAHVGHLHQGRGCDVVTWTTRLRDGQVGGGQSLVWL